MPFWTYMLHCRDRTFYVGHTDDLDVRIAQHEQGTIRGYTARKRPATLVWSAEFPTRYEALEAERQIKGWRREKKLALIRGDWDEISRLSREGKGRPSTSSGQTAQGGPLEPPHPDRPEPVEGRPLYLFRHPQSVSPAVGNIRVSVKCVPGWLRLDYALSGDVNAIALPSTAEPRRQDNLWQHTCFEAFIRYPDGTYHEFNFSPSSAWAAYSFAGYRSGMLPLDIVPPRAKRRQSRSELRLAVEIEIADLPPNALLNLTAVIEEKSGRKSYWALAHPPDGPPDFHHPACFVLELPPPPQQPSPRT